MTDPESRDNPAAVTADDALIDALSEARLTDDTDEVICLLAAWRRAVRAEGVPELVGTAEAATAIQVARQRFLRAEIDRRRWELAAAFLATLVIILAGIGLVVCR